MKRYHHKDCTNSSLQGEVEQLCGGGRPAVTRSLRSLLPSVHGSRKIAGLQANWHLSVAWPMSLAPTNGGIRCKRIKKLKKNRLYASYK